MVSPAPEHGRLSPVFLGLAVAVLTTLAFLPAWDAQWLNWDDPANFFTNTRWRGLDAESLRWMWTSTWMGHYQPLAWMSLAVDHALWGMDAPGYHRTNLLLHGVSAGLSFAVLRRLFPDFGRVGWTVGALFFAIHPLRVESVAWVTERRDVLAMTFFLGATLAWTSFVRDGRRAAFVLALLLHVASLASKAHAVTFPAVLLVLDVWPFRRGGPVRLVLEKIPFLLASGAFAGMAIHAQAEAGALMSVDALPLAERVRVALYGLSTYPGKILLPLDQGPLYAARELQDYPIAASALALTTLTTLAIVLRRRAPGFLAGWLLYVGMLLPVSGLFQSGAQLVADRYTLFAGLPFAAGVCWAAAVSVRRAPVALAVWGVLLALLAGGTFRYTRAWHDSVSLWTWAVERDPSDGFAWMMLGVSLEDYGRLDAAVEPLRRAVALGGAAAAPVEYARLLVRLERGTDALAALEGVRSGPFVATADCLAGRALMQVGRPEEGLVRIRRGVAAGCDDPPAAAVLEEQ